MSNHQDVLLWEAVEAIRIIQYVQKKAGMQFKGLRPFMADDEIGELCRMAGVDADTVCGFDFSKAYRAVETSKASYAQTLDVYGVPGTVYAPISLTTYCVAPCRPQGIVVAPFPSHQDMFIPANIWTFIIRALRSYGLPVYLMGEKGIRMDSAIFTEGEILCNLSMQQKVTIIKDARLVVGPPNAWPHIALGQGSNLLVPYSVTVPDTRWFPEVTKQYANTYGRVYYSPYQLEAASFITAMREVIKQMQ